MYSIEITTYGIKGRREGFPDDEGSRELLRQYLQALEALKRTGKPFGHLWDLRGFKPGGPETQEAIKTMMQKFKEAGGIRSAVILDSPIAVIRSVGWEENRASTHGKDTSILRRTPISRRRPLPGLNTARIRMFGCPVEFPFRLLGQPGAVLISATV